MVLLRFDKQKKEWMEILREEKKDGDI